MSMQLQKMFTSHFAGMNVDVVKSENSEPCITREQLGLMLGYSLPSDSIARIHNRNKQRIDPLSGVVKLTTPGGGTQETTVYPFKAVLEICRYSNQPNANAVIDWAWDTLDKLRNGGIICGTMTAEQRLLEQENNRLTIENEELYFENKKLKKREELHQKLGGAIYLHDVAIQLFHLGIGDGNENALVKKLVANGILQKDQSAKRRYLIRPYLRHVRHGYFVHRLDSSDQPVPIIQSKILVTPKGFDWIVGEFEKIDNRDYGQNHPLLGYIRECMRIPAEAGGPIEITDERGVNHKYI